MSVSDIAIIGAGPAGLSAALYCARFLRSTLVLHDASPRARRIPRTHNVPGYGDGIAGPDMLDHMAAHAQTYGAQFEEARIIDVARDDDCFTLAADDGRQWRARALILATGIRSESIALPAEVEADAVEKSILRWCPICDGYEHQGQRIGVIGSDRSGAAEALFLRTYSDKITLIPRHDVELDAAERRELNAAGITIVTTPARQYEATAAAMHVRLEGEDDPLIFDVIYPALGSHPRNELAQKLGLEVDEDGKLAADSVGGTPIPGVYAAGDIVAGLDQISVAIGHGALAATRAHNWLRERDGETVEQVIDDAGSGAAAHR